MHQYADPIRVRIARIDVIDLSNLRRSRPLIFYLGKISRHFTRGRYCQTSRGVYKRTPVAVSVELASSAAELCILNDAIYSLVPTVGA